MIIAKVLYMPKLFNPRTKLLFLSLDRLQILLLALIILTIPTGFRQYVFLYQPSYLWQDGTQTNVFPEFRGIVLFLADYFVFSLVILSLVRVIFDKRFRKNLSTFIEELFTQYKIGGWLALALWVSVSGFWGAFPRLAHYSGFLIFLDLGIAILIAYLASQDYLKWIALAFVLGCVGQSLIAIAQIINGGSLGLDWLGETNWHWSPNLTDPALASVHGLRANGLAVNPNNLAGYLVVGLWAGRWLRATLHHKLLKAVLNGALGIIILGLLATVSRSAIVAWVMVSLVIYIFRQQSLPTFKIPSLRTMLFISAIVLIFVLLGWSDIVGTRFSYTTLSNDLATRNFLEDDTMQVLQEHWLLGVGANNVMLKIAYLNPLDEKLLLPIHNVYLLIWAEVGLIGLGLFIFAIGASLRQIKRDASIFWIGAVFSLLLIMLVDYYLWGDYPSRLMFFIVLGAFWERQSSRLADQESQIASIT